MLDYVMSGLGLPDWAPPGSRYYENTVNGLWLKGKQYQHIPYAFTDTRDRSGRALKLFDKRPSVRLNLPYLGARLSSRKLLVGKHAPIVETDSEQFKKDIKWLVTKSKLYWYGADAAFNGQAGSAAMILSIVDELPIIQVAPGKNCIPTYDDANRLTNFQTNYVIRGIDWLAQKTKQEQDSNGDNIDPAKQYWFIRIWTPEVVTTVVPVPVGDWNPEQGWTKQGQGEFKPVPDLSDIHNLGLVPVVWIRNIADCDSIDGMSSFGIALPNCLHLDVTLSNMGRGFNYMGNPQLFVKGKILSAGGSQTHTYNMDTMLQVAADKRNADGSGVSGAEAKLLEMSADGLKVGLEFWVEKVKHWTLESISLSRKDPNNLKGAMSGTAIALIDEDFFDFVESLKMPYGEMGILEVVKIFIRMYKILGIGGRFEGVSDDQIEEIELDWPRLYEAEPQEVQYLVTALSGAVTAGFMNTEEGSDILAAALDKELTWTEPEQNTLIEKPGQAQEDDLAMRQQDQKLKEKQLSQKPKPAAKK